ncbi:hypothetical protein [Caldiplasma sukawensis]
MSKKIKQSLTMLIFFILLIVSVAGFSNSQINAENYHSLKSLRVNPFTQNGTGDEKTGEIFNEETFSFINSSISSKIYNSRNNLVLDLSVVCDPQNHVYYAGVLEISNRTKRGLMYEYNYHQIHGYFTSANYYIYGYNLSGNLKYKIKIENVIPGEIFFSKLSKQIFVYCKSEDAMCSIGVANNGSLYDENLIRIGVEPSSVICDEKIEKIIVGSDQSKDIIEINPFIDKVVANVVIGFGISYLTLANSVNLLFAIEDSKNCIYEINPENLSLINNTQTKSVPIRVFFNKYDKQIYILCQNFCSLYSYNFTEENYSSFNKYRVVGIIPESILFQYNKIDNYFYCVPDNKFEDTFSTVNIWNENEKVTISCNIPFFGIPSFIYITPSGDSIIGPGPFYLYMLKPDFIFLNPPLLRNIPPNGKVAICINTYVDSAIYCNENGLFYALSGQSGYYNPVIRIYNQYGCFGKISSGFFIGKILPDEHKDILIIFPSIYEINFLSGNIFYSSSCTNIYSSFISGSFISINNLMDFKNLMDKILNYTLIYNLNETNGALLTNVGENFFANTSGSNNIFNYSGIGFVSLQSDYISIFQDHDLMNSSFINIFDGEGSLAIYNYLTGKLVFEKNVTGFPLLSKFENFKKLMFYTILIARSVKIMITNLSNGIISTDLLPPIFYFSYLLNYKLTEFNNSLFFNYQSDLFYYFADIHLIPCESNFSLNLKNLIDKDGIRIAYFANITNKENLTSVNSFNKLNFIFRNNQSIGNVTVTQLGNYFVLNYNNTSGLTYIYDDNFSRTMGTFYNISSISITGTGYSQIISLLSPQSGYSIIISPIFIQQTFSLFGTNAIIFFAFQVALLSAGIATFYITKKYRTPKKY